MKKLLKMIGGFICAFVAITAFCAVTKAGAAQKVSTLYDYRLKSDVTDEQTYTHDNGLSIEVSTVMPKLQVVGHPVITKRINKTIEEFAINNDAAVYGDAAKAEDKFGTDRKVTIEKKYASLSRCGNILSITFTTYVEAEGAAYPYNGTETLNIYLSTGKKIASLTSLFSNVTAVKKAIADEIKTQMNARVRAGASYLEPSKKEIRKALTLDDCTFDISGITVAFDEYESFGMHAEGITEYFISYDKFADYIRDSKKQLFRPASTYCFMLSYSAGTGYSWTVEVADENVAAIAGDGSYQVVQDPMLSGGSMRDVYIFKAVAPGKTKVTAKLIRPWETDGEPADTKEITLVVAKDLSISVK